MVSFDLLFVSCGILFIIPLSMFMNRRGINYFPSQSVNELQVEKKKKLEAPK